MSREFGMLAGKAPLARIAFDRSSPDGKLAAFGTLEHSGGHKQKLAVVATDSGQTRLLDFATQARAGPLQR